MNDNQKQSFEKLNRRYTRELTHSVRHGFSKSKINEFIRILHNIEIRKIFLHQKRDYKKSWRSSFNGDYIEYENKGVKNKNFLL